MLPRFTVALPQDALLQSRPPFDFPGVSMRIFPLRADMTRVQTLVDGWINAQLPPEIAYFRAFSPFVTLVALNYGRASVIPANLGWSSQKEVTFSIPLQWYRRTRRGFQLLDMAVLTPFIFVDNDLSIPAGREVFGWQKNLIWMDALADTWLENPRAPKKHAGISTRAFREVYTGQREEPMPFVAIDEAPAGAAVQYPADRQNPLLPWVALANSMDGALGLAQDMVDLLAGLGIVRKRRAPLRGGRYADLDPRGSAGEMLRILMRTADLYDPNLSGNEINLKQFRDAEHPTTACYQDINNTVMRVKEINRLGLLGEMRTLLGDITGGYRITLHQWESLPIADMLGLEAARKTDVDGASVVTLKPVLPMWADMDLLYAAERQVIAWRSKDHPWTPGPGALGPSARQRNVPLPPPKPRKTPKKIPYNTALGSSSPVIYGPFETPKATIRVLPLLATQNKLKSLIDRALNAPLGNGGDGGAPISFAPWGRYVYLVIQTADATYSVDNNIGAWPSRTTRFLIPVRRYSHGEPAGFALYCPFSFSSSTLDAVSSSEINGMGVMSAQIESPASSWLDDGGPAVGRGRDLCTVRALIPPLLSAGERARTRTLLQVSQRSTDVSATIDEEELNAHWALHIKRDLDLRQGLSAGGANAAPLDIARARALDILGDQAGLPFVAKKQFRDVERPDLACYQALVEVEERLLHVERVEEINTPLEVTLFDYESMPIAKVLGLVHRSSGYKKGLRYRKIEPIRPFWMIAMVREELGKNLAEQRRDLLWISHEQAASRSLIAPERAIAPGAFSDEEQLENVRKIDLGNPRHLSRLLSVERCRGSARASESPTALAASAAVEASRQTAEELGTAPGFSAPGPQSDPLSHVEPQWVIETVLSREWESRHNPVWLEKEEEIEQSAASARGGFKTLTEQALAEIKELVAQRRRITGRAHSDIQATVDSLLLPRFVALTWISAEARHLHEVQSAENDPLRRKARASAPPPLPVPAPLDPFHHFATDGEETPLQEDRGMPAAESPEAAPSPPDGSSPSALYNHSHFDALEAEEPEMLRRTDGVLAEDVVVGGLIKTVLGLCGSSAKTVFKPHPYHAPSEAAHVTGSVADMFEHFAEPEEPSAPDYGRGAALPFGLSDDLSKDATATLATARSLVYLAWKAAAEDPVSKLPVWQSFVADAAREVTAARQALILALAKCWQKPFFCVRRDTAGSPELAAEVFPEESIWPDRDGVAWYFVSGQ